jgi:hypothetical protein
LVNKGVRTPAKLDFLPEEGEEGIVARTRDFDGNMLEAVFRPRQLLQNARRGGCWNGRSRLRRALRRMAVVAALRLSFRARMSRADIDRRW